MKLKYCFPLLLLLAASCLEKTLGAPVDIPEAAAKSVGAEVHYQLPTTGPLPKTYRVTLASVDPKDPNWIISTFAAGVVRTVTTENQGRFTETWNGLDDNYMPVPPGTYALKGIFMPAEKWEIDGLYHTIVPKLASAGSSWNQSPSEDTLPGKIEGDPCGGPLRDVDVAPSGKGAVYFQYLENGRNYFLTDFTKPIGYSQIITGYSSAVFAGGSSTCTDGEVIWSFCNEAGKRFVGRADGKPFGKQKAARDNVYLPDGWVKALAAWPDHDLGHTVVFSAEGGRIVKGGRDYVESDSDLIDEVRALDGVDAHILATWKIQRPLGVVARHGKLYILHGGGGADFEVLSIPLGAGWDKAQPSRLFTVPAGVKPFDVEVDSHDRIYLSDSDANHVYQFDAHGKGLLTFGKLDAQKGGTYDPLSFMAPEKLACWTDAQGKDRLLVVEQSGPNRLSEWSCDDGKMIRQWVVPQTRANDGYAVDPRHPDRLYVPGQGHTLVRWKIDYVTGQWTPEAVWTNVGTTHNGSGEFDGKLLQPLACPRLIYRGDELYLAFWKGYAIYHLEGEKWRACAGIFQKRVDRKRVCYLWSDLNADGEVQEDEYLPFPTTPPQGTLRYFGESWAEDFSLLCMGRGTNDIWRLPAPSFDSHGTPIFDPNGWTKMLSDPTFEAKKAGTVTATRGGNEVGVSYSSDWASVTNAPNGDVYVSARSGPNVTANFGTQFKLSRYVPDGKGGYTERWRVGRMAIRGNAVSGEVYGPIFVNPPINGLVGLVDNSRAGYVLYTEEGLYVDTLFPDSHFVSHDQMGAYWQPAEFFAGYNYVNQDNGKVYIALGKTVPLIYEAKGWTTTENPVKPLISLDKTVKLAAKQIDSPPEVAMTIRGGAAASRVARFYPAPGGGPALDGSMAGWEACDPVVFSAGNEQTVEARCYYDPEHLFIRWHVRLGHAFVAKPLELPQHIFAHDQGNDTLGLYLQGDPEAIPGPGLPDGRPGDVRFVFGIFKLPGAGDPTGPIILGMYPKWSDKVANPQTYKTPVGSVTFAHVAVVPGVSSGYKIDEDGNGFVLAAAIPRTALPGVKTLCGWRSLGNFDANLGGVNRFWWSNVDGSASRETFDEPTEARLYPGSWSPVYCLPIENKLAIQSWMAIGPFGFPQVTKLDLLKDRPMVVKTLCESAFPPDTERNMAATYEGDLTQTRAARRTATWKAVHLSTDLVDFKTVLNWTSYNDEGTTYLLTHIYTPQPAEVLLNAYDDARALDIISGQLNGKPLPQTKEKNKIRLDNSKPLSLQAGWNELLIRRDLIYGGQLFGASLMADPAVLWKLKISGPPPH